MFDISTIYCLATGKPIATLSDEEFGIALEAYGHYLPSERKQRLEELALNSMRPSLAWSNVSPDSLANLRIAAPRELLAYLLNRLFAPLVRPKTNLPVNYESFLQARRFRIDIWQKLESSTFSEDEVGQLLFILLDLDTRFNLQNLSKPTQIGGLWATHGEATWVESIIIHLNDWREDLVAKQEKEERLAKVTANWFAKGNKLTGVARFDSFMAAKPVTRSAKISPKKAAKKAEEDLFASILDGFMAKETPIGQQPTAPMTTPSEKLASYAAAKVVNQRKSATTFVPKGSGPMRFGVKSNA